MLAAVAKIRWKCSVFMFSKEYCVLFSPCLAGGAGLVCIRLASNCAPVLTSGKKPSSFHGVQCKYITYSTTQIRKGTNANTNININCGPVHTWGKKPSSFHGFQFELKKNEQIMNTNVNITRKIQHKFHGKAQEPVKPLKFYDLISILALLDTIESQNNLIKCGKRCFNIVSVKRWIW